ncbi:F-box protein dre-1 [Exaiptasia diaphana]|nr:F-box protein dre-1 [Exaiptasia diaphana]
MEMFLRALNLTPTEEKKVTDNLKDWETKGMQLCLGHIVDSDLVKLIEREVSQLSNEVQALETKQEEEFKKVHEALTSVKDYIEEFKRSVTTKLQNLQTSHENLEQEVADMAEDLGALQIDHRKLKDDVSSAMISLEKHDQLEGRVSALETAIENKNSTFLKSTFKAPNRIPSFYGRVQELERLAMAIEGKTAHCIISAICGLGGTGKTSLAIEHVWRYKDIYKGGVFWLSGESVPNFKNSICEIARDVGTFDKDFGEMLSATLHWLKTRSELWCVIIDNLDEYDLTSSGEMMKVLNGHWKNDTSGHMIITTRRDDRQIQEDVPTVSPENCIELGTFSEQESIQFMKKRTDRHVAGNDVEILKELSSELGYLPLALDQAAAYIKYTTVQFSRYLEQYKKQKLKTLKRSKALFPAQDTSTERIAVGTTWQLNFEYVRRLSEDYGIGKAACLIMEVSAFLSPDDIPMELINEGLPQVENSDLQDCLAFPTGAIDIISILTKFSLFQRFTDKSLSVHRLVQEVIRNNISGDDKTKNVLQSGSRMLHHAFVNSDSPVKVCQSFQGDSVFHQTNPPSLHLWGTLGSHASTFQGHLIDASQNDTCQELICTEETAFLLNEASLYLYVCRQKVKAMELQKEKLKILTSLQMSEEKMSHLQYFEIPLKPMEFKLISRCMSHKEQMKVLSSAEQETQENTAKADEWRENGNSAFKKQDYQGAIDCYNVALKWSSNDCRLLCNRALCYLQINQAEKALDDCERCLRVEKHNKKALRRKAWALYEISGKQAHLIGRSRATAAIAAHVDPTAFKVKDFTERFPNLCYVEIFNSAQLVAHLLYLNVDTTFLLHDGNYELQGAVIDKNVQFVAIDGPTTISFGQPVMIFGSHLYAEGITFPRESEGVICQLGGSVTMLMCHISNGMRSCEDYPECNGGDGCIAALNGLEPCNRSGHFGEEKNSGVSGYPGIQVLHQCTGYFENCDIEGCGGGGILSHGEGSKLYVKGCKVHHNHQSGLEAREGGCLEAIDNDIYSNGTHGIMIGPKAGASEIIQNRIYENRKEGVFVLISKKNEVNIMKNRIYHNLQFGLSLDRCLVGIKQNDIFENGFHGIHAKTQTTASIENNDIYANKCGGIHMGVNFSGRVIIKSNTIRDHSGLWLVHVPEMNEKFQTIRKKDPTLFLPEGETRYYSNPPVVEANVLQNNKERMFHPQEKMEVIKNECTFCRNIGKLLQCSRCNMASYCSTTCQENHWGKHQMLCSSLSKKYFVIVDFKPFEDRKNCISTRTFGPHLKGIGQGIKPDFKSRRRFIVKIQTGHLNSHPLQMLTLYDQTTSLDGEIQSPEVFHIIMECGVLGGDKTLGSQFTSKKAFFYATFVDKNPKKLKINLAELADYKDW